MKRQTFKRGVALLMSLLMLCGATPQTAFADTGESPPVAVETVAEDENETITAEDTRTDEEQTPEETVTKPEVPESSEDAQQDEESTEAKETVFEEPKEKEVDLEQDQTSDPEEKSTTAANSDETGTETPDSQTPEETTEANLEPEEKTEADENADTQQAQEASEEPEAEVQRFSGIAEDSILSEEQLGGIDFSSKRLVLIGDESIIVDPEHILSSYDGVYLLQYDDPETARNAYSYYYGKAVFVDVDGMMSIADGTQEGAGSEMSENDNPLTYLEDAQNGAVANGNETVVLIDTGSNADGVERVSFVGDDGSDQNGHGTRMIGYIREYAPNAKIISAKAIGNNGTGDASAVYAAILYAKEIGAKYINLSMSAIAKPGNLIVEKAIDEATAAGITVIGAAGNNGNDAKYFIPGRVASAMIIGACDADGNKLSVSNAGSTVDYYVMADSTSEAAARFTGLTLAGITPDSGKTLNGTDHGVPEGDDQFTAAETVALSNGIYYTTIPYAQRVENQLNRLLKSGNGKDFDISFYHPNISNAANDNNGSHGISGDILRIWHNAAGEPYYCYDLSASDEGSRSIKNFADLSSSIADKTKVAKVYTVAAMLTGDNFKLLRDHADEIFHDFTISYKGSSYSFSMAKVREFVKSGSGEALIFCRGVVQTYIWDRMNSPAYQSVMKDVTTGGAWGYNKEGERVWIPASHHDWSMPGNKPIDYDALEGIGFGAAGGQPGTPGKVSSGDRPGNPDNPGKVGGQLLILTMLTAGTLRVEKVSGNMAITSGNSAYSLKNAEFTVYTNEGCTTKAKDTAGNDAIIKTDANGKGSVELESGTYWIKETKAPPGFKVNPTAYKVELPAGGDKTQEVKEQPYGDPINLTIRKTDGKTGKDVRRVEL